MCKLDLQSFTFACQSRDHFVLLLNVLCMFLFELS
eukprot:XP_001706949.1 Hypothetical protein GL50803_39341 [Giardia lamblia ATCC 50803]